MSKINLSLITVQVGIPFYIAMRFGILYCFVIRGNMVNLYILKTVFVFEVFVQVSVQGTRNIYILNIENI